MNGTASEQPARTGVDRTLDTLKYFFEAALDDARTVLRTAQAIVRDRENGGPEDSPAGKPKQPAVHNQQSTPLTATQVRDIRRRYQPGEAASALARKYGRARTTIQDIACRGSWKHIPPGPGEYRQPAPPPPDKTTPAPRKTSAPENATSTGGSAGPTAPAPKGTETAAPTPADMRTTAGGDAAATPGPTPPAAPEKKEADPPPREGSQATGTNSELTEAQVREIRRTYRPRRKTKALAKKHGVSTATVLNIANRRTWKNLKPGPGEYQPPAATTHKLKTATPKPQPRDKHVPAHGGTAAPKRASAPTQKPNGAGHGTPQPAPGDPAAARINAEKKRLTPDSIRNIRERTAEGTPPRRIARDFGVSEDTVRALAG